MQRQTSIYVQGLTGNVPSIAAGRETQNQPDSAERPMGMYFSNIDRFAASSFHNALIGAIVAPGATALARMATICIFERNGTP